MRGLGLALLMTISGVASATAADLSSRILTKAPAATDSAYNWGGWYAGGHIGGSWGTSDVGNAFVNGTVPIANQQTFAATSPQLNRPASAAAGRSATTIRWIAGCSVSRPMPATLVCAKAAP